MTQLTKADHKLFRGTAAEVHSWMSNKEILKSIGCDFNVERVPHHYKATTFPEVQLWHRTDNHGLLGVLDQGDSAFSLKLLFNTSKTSVMQVKKLSI